MTQPNDKPDLDALIGWVRNGISCVVINKKSYLIDDLVAYALNQAKADRKRIEAIENCGGIEDKIIKGLRRFHYEHAVDDVEDDGCILRAADLIADLKRENAELRDRAK